MQKSCVHAPRSALKFSFPSQQDSNHSGPEFPVAVMSLVTFWLKFNKTFKFGGQGLRGMHGVPTREELPDASPLTCCFSGWPGHA